MLGQFYNSGKSKDKLGEDYGKICDISFSVCILANV